MFRKIPNNMILHHHRVLVLVLVTLQLKTFFDIFKNNIH